MLSRDHHIDPFQKPEREDRQHGRHHAEDQLSAAQPLAGAVPIVQFSAIRRNQVPPLRVAPTQVHNPRSSHWTPERHGGATPPKSLDCRRQNPSGWRRQKIAKRTERRRTRQSQPPPCATDCASIGYWPPSQPAWFWSPSLAASSTGSTFAITNPPTTPSSPHAASRSRRRSAAMSPKCPSPTTSTSMPATCWHGSTTATT